jgi:hypothetical protein
VEKDPRGDRHVQGFNRAPARNAYEYVALRPDSLAETLALVAHYQDHRAAPDGQLLGRHLGATIGPDDDRAARAQASKRFGQIRRSRKHQVLYAALRDAHGDWGESWMRRERAKQCTFGGKEGCAA